MDNQNSKKYTFGELFKKYRLKSEIESLTEFGDILADEGLYYESSLFAKWQSNTRVPKDRKILKALIKIFYKRGGISNLKDANTLFESAEQGYLTEAEIQDLNFFSNAPPIQIPRKVQGVDRNQFIIEASNKLQNGKIVLLYGQPGVGKTKMAIDIAHYLKDSFLDGVLWFQLDVSSTGNILNSIANSFGVI